MPRQCLEKGDLVQRQHNRILTSILPIVFSAVTIAIVLILSLIYKVHEHPFLIDEGGVIESLSAIGYLACLLLAMFAGKWTYIRRYNYFLILIASFGLRELDFDKRFTTMGLLKTDFYLSSNVPLIEKLIGLVVVAILAYSVVCIIRNHSKGFASKVMKLSPVHIGVLITIMLLVLTKSIDGIRKKLAIIGISLSKDSYKIFMVIEEVLELGIPLMILAVYIIYFSSQASDSEASRGKPRNISGAG